MLGKLTKNILMFLCLNLFSQNVYSTDERYLFYFIYVEFGELDAVKSIPLEKIETYKNIEGDSLLHYAVKKNQVEIVEYLLSLKVFDLSLKNDYGKSVMDELENVEVKIEHLVLKELRRIRAFNYILQGNLVDFEYYTPKMERHEYRDRDGDTLVMAAIRTGDYNIVSKVLQLSPFFDLNIKNKKGDTAFSLAHAGNYLTIYFALRKYSRSIKTALYPFIKKSTSSARKPKLKHHHPISERIASSLR